VFDALKPAMFPETRLILNADDPLSACFALDRDNVRWFGLDRCSISTEEPTGVYHDGAYCPICKSPMEYRYYHFNHIGSYHCPSCEFGKPFHVDYTATALDLERGLLTIDEEFTIHLAFRSIYNVYNILAAYAVCRECGVVAKHIGKVVNNYILKNGRMVRFLLGAHHGMLLTSKHENSIAYDTNLRYVRSTEDPCTVVLIVDAVSRKYYTSETSWLWDIDFSLLNCEHVQKVLLCGQYASDLAVRFSFTDVPPEKIELHPDIAEACNSLKAGGAEDVYVLTCFSDRDKLLSQAEKEAV
jgi:Zn ribbon nucleic-acid-binding protein